MREKGEGRGDNRRRKETWGGEERGREGEEMGDIWGEERK